MKRAAISLFAQMISLLPRDLFETLSSQFNQPKDGRSRNAQKYTRWDQLIALLFSQLAHCDSLREIEDGLYSIVGKLGHLDAKALKRTSLSYQNHHYDYQLFEKFYYALLKRFESQQHVTLSRTYKKPVYSLDSTTISLCLSLFDWARYRSTKGGIKLHTVLNHQTHLPQLIDITEGKVADVSEAKNCIAAIPASSIVVMDRGYNDYSLFKWITDRGGVFVTRIKETALTTPLKAGKRAECADKWGDYEFEFSSESARQVCGNQKFRLIQWFDDIEERWFDFITNDFEMTPEQVAELYKERWQIETFFKKVKQNLVIKTFIGTSRNAVMSQIWTAAITILLIEMIRRRSSYPWGYSRLAKYLQVNLMTHKDLTEYVNRPDIPPHRHPPGFSPPQTPVQMVLFE